MIFFYRHAGIQFKCYGFGNMLGGVAHIASQTVSVTVTLSVLCTHELDTPFLSTAQVHWHEDVIQRISHAATSVYSSG